MTDLEKVKRALLLFTDAFDVVPDEFCFVSHPYTNSVLVIFKDKTFGDITKEEDYKKWRHEVNERISKIQSERNLESFFYSFVNKPYLLTLLKYIKPYIDTDLFSTLLADAWVKSENPNQDKNVSISTLTKWFKECNKSILMDKEDLDYYLALPEEIEIFRGVSVGREKYGLSWTDSREKAEWFRDRWKDADMSKERYLLSCVIPKRYALAYLNTRDEREIVVDVVSLKRNKKIAVTKEEL